MSERAQLRADEAFLQRAGIARAHPTVDSNCEDAPGPCPFVGCRQHLYLNVNPRNGSITFNFPGREPWELEETCALRKAKQGPQSMVTIGRLFNVTAERITQVYKAAVAKSRHAGPAEDLGEDEEAERFES